MKKIDTFVADCCVILSVAFGFFVRVSFAIHRPLWLDETIALATSKFPIIDLILQQNQYWDYAHPPFFYMFVKLLSHIGITELFLRTPALASFLISAFFIYKISEKLYNSKFITFIVLTYFSFHSFLIQRGAELWMYSLILPVFSIIIYKIIVYIQSENPSVFDSITLVLLLIICFYMDYSSIWLIGTVFILAIILKLFNPKKYRNFIPLFFPFIIMIVPQLYMLITHVHNIKKLATHIQSAFQYSVLEELALFPDLVAFNNIGLVVFFITIGYMIFMTNRTYIKKIFIFQFTHFYLLDYYFLSHFLISFLSQSRHYFT